MSRIVWTPEKRFLSELKPYDRNPRIIAESGIHRMHSSFNEIGMAQPININTKGTILSGHARFLALAHENGWKIDKAIDENTGREILKVFEEGEDVQVDVLVPDRELTPKQEEAILIRMNATEGGSWDIEKLQDSFAKDDLVEWGIDNDWLQDTKEVNEADETAEWANSNGFDSGNGYIKLIIHFESEEDRAQYCEDNGIEVDKKLSKQWIVNA